MKLRNKKTGELGKLYCDMQVNPMKIGVFEDTDIRGHYWEYNSLADLNEEWEDYEEPKEHWYISYQGEVYVLDPNAVPEYSRNARAIGNYFETKEEAERAVEKLKAWVRLKKKGLRFTGFEETDRGCLGDYTIYCYIKPDYTRPQDDVEDDLDLLFGDEE